MKISCGIFTNIAPLYSRPLWYKLSESKKVEYTFYSGNEGFSGIQTIPINESSYVNIGSKLNWIFLRNFVLFGILFFQRGIIYRCLNSDHQVYILSGEMHVVTNWIASLICKIKRKPLIFWGHGLYGREIFFKKVCRIIYYKIADFHLVYGNRSRGLMIKEGFSVNRVFTVYNSLNFDVHRIIYKNKNQIYLDDLRAELFPVNSEWPIVIFMGRLTKEKKIPLLLQAIKLSKECGILYNCLIVGGGSEENMLHELSVDLGIAGMVYFYGPSYDEELNGNMLMLSECCISPGNIGLTAIHSLSFGTPVITHKNMFHQGPEAEVVIPNETGMLFDENSAADLSESINKIVMENLKPRMESNCRKIIEDYWNPDKQVSVIDEVVVTSQLKH